MLSHLFLGIIACGPKICTAHRIFYIAWLVNHSFYLSRKLQMLHPPLPGQANMRWASSIFWYIDRHLSMPTEGFVCANLSSFFSLILLMRCQKSAWKWITSWNFCQIFISVQSRCIWRESIRLYYTKSASDQCSSCCSTYFLKIISKNENVPPF